MGYRVMCGYSMTSYPRSTDTAPAAAVAVTWNSPAAVFAAGAPSNSTVRDSSPRGNALCCAGGDTVHPAGAWRRTVESVAAGRSLTTVTLISRVALGGAAAGAGRAAP